MPSRNVALDKMVADLRNHYDTDYDTTVPGKEFDAEIKRIVLRHLAVAPPSGETPALLTTAKEREAAAYAGEGLYAEGFNAGSWNNDFVARLAKDCIALAAAPQTGGWIATAERLPDSVGWYIVVNESGYVHTSHFNGDQFPSFVITHWQPLPQPPMTEERKEAER